MPPQSRERRREEEHRGAGFFRARKAESGFASALRGLARQIARIIEAFGPENPDDPIEPHNMARITEALDNYGEAIEPWARAVSWRMVAETNRRDKSAWQQYTAGMSAALREELRNAPIGEEVDRLLAGQVDLITSLPHEAAMWVHERSLRALEEGQRYQEKTALESGYNYETGMWRRTPPPRTELAERVAMANPRETEAWVRNRATLIARTETARTASVLVQARSKHIGAELYEWKTAGDWKVRESHRKLERQRTKYGVGIYSWAEAPLSDPPDYHSHPGQIWNCRCTALPIIPTV